MTARLSCNCSETTSPCGLRPIMSMPMPPSRKRPRSLPSHKQRLRRRRQLPLSLRHRSFLHHLVPLVLCARGGPTLDFDKEFMALGAVLEESGEDVESIQISGLCQYQWILRSIHQYHTFRMLCFDDENLVLLCGLGVIHGVSHKRVGFLFCCQTTKPRRHRYEK